MKRAMLCVLSALLLPALADAAPSRGSGQARWRQLSWSQLSDLLATHQSDEPTAPGGADEPTTPAAGDEPTTPASGDEPTAPGPAGPGAPGVDEPGGNAPAGEPAPPTVPEQTVAKKKPAVQYGAGFHMRGIFIPSWFLKLFLAQATSLNSLALGGEFIRRKGDFDLIGSMDFGFFSPSDGNYLGKSKDPAIDTDYVQFRDLNILAFNVHFIWHHNFNEWLSLVYGAGVGLGIVLGDIFRISNGSGCTQENAGDFPACRPVGVAANGSNLGQFLAANAGSESEDTAATPKLFKEDSVPPVIPVVHMLVGVNFKISEQISVRLDGGFRNAFYIGSTAHYFF